MGSINHNGSLFDGIEDLERFALQDKDNPYLIGRGIVMHVFKNPEDRTTIFTF
jgi:hypothetical protein